MVVLDPAGICTLQEMVLLVGYPSSGKSTLRERYFTPHGYVTVNRDALGTQNKCLAVASDSLREGKSVVVDNTNPSRSIRKAYIDLGTKHSVPVRCIHLGVDRELAVHLNYFRQNLSKGVKRRVPAVGYRVYEKHFEMPEVSEGFVEVKRIEFVPLFASKSDKDLFMHWNSAE